MKKSGRNLPLLPVLALLHPGITGNAVICQWQNRYVGDSSLPREEKSRRQWQFCLAYPGGAAPAIEAVGE
jgi:hypothetical protein